MDGLYRSPEDITALFALTIDEFLQIVAESDLTSNEKSILEHLRKSKLELQPQLMHLFEAPMDDIDFKDILRQTLKPVIDAAFDHARSDGIITEREQKLLDTIVLRLKI